tara:strand:+ start:6624 stop:6743 length:120 start_codon:yes stop_codon:yes gene_type:complete
MDRENILMGDIDGLQIHGNTDYIVDLDGHLSRPRIHTKK